MNLSRDLLGGKLEQIAELGSGPVGPRDGKKFGDTSAARTLARFYYCLSGLFGPRFFFLNIASRARTQNLEVLPSPYVAGCFDYLMGEPYDFHASQETHRGCP